MLTYYVVLVELELFMQIYFKSEGKCKTNFKNILRWYTITYRGGLLVKYLQQLSKMRLVLNLSKKFCFYHLLVQ
jgi:hypothetical protein